MTRGHSHAIDFAAEFVAELVRHGVDRAVVCPGNRSAPLVFALHARGDVRKTVVVDERVGAFVALGLGLAAGRPALLVCTSGSAGAHFAPALAEARANRVPVIVVTADRPTELHDVGADQTMPQAALFGDLVGWHLDLEAPNGKPSEAAHARRVAQRAVSQALVHGPVHLNLRFRDPLEPPPGAQIPAPPVDTVVPAQPGVVVDAAAAVRVQAAIDRSSRPLLVIGQHAAPPAVLARWAEWAALTGVPVVADALSGALGSAQRPTLVGTADALLRERARVRGLAPDLVIRLGRMPTSKAFRLWLGEHSEAEQLVVDPLGLGIDPTLGKVEFVNADPGVLVDAVLQRAAASKGSAWFRAWLAADSAARAAYRARVEDATLPHEAWAAHTVLEATRAGEPLVVASSMPIRDVDLCAGAMGTDARLFCNRGLNGIDGTVATAVGVAAASGAEHGWALAGDLATQHDVGAFAALARSEVPVTLVVVDNGGGGIFGFLPVGRHAVVFETYFLTAQSVDLVTVAKGFGLPAERVRDVGELAGRLQAARRRRRSSVVVVEVDREASRASHMELWREMGMAAAAAFIGARSSRGA